MARDVALIVGVGPGLGQRSPAASRMAGSLWRSRRAIAGKLDALAREVGGRAYACDATDAVASTACSQRSTGTSARPRSRCSMPARSARAVLEIEPGEFEQLLADPLPRRIPGGTAAARRMVAAGHGTILFTGATAALAAARALPTSPWPSSGCARSRSPWRASWAQGIHVAHSSSTARSAPSATRIWRRSAARRAARPRRHRRDLLAAARAAAQRLDPGARSTALGGEVLASCIAASRCVRQLGQKGLVRAISRPVVKATRMKLGPSGSST